MKIDPAAVAFVAEVADALAPYGNISCHPTIEEDDGLWTLSIVFRPLTLEQSLEVLELTARLSRIQDIAQLRGLVERYGSEFERLEGLLRSATDPQSEVP